MIKRDFLEWEDLDNIIVTKGTSEQIAFEDLISLPHNTASFVESNKEMTESTLASNPPIDPKNLTPKN